MIKILKDGSNLQSVSVEPTKGKGGILFQPDFFNEVILVTVSEPKTSDVATVEVKISDLFEAIKQLSNKGI